METMKTNEHVDIAEIRNLLRGVEYALDHPGVHLNTAVWRLVDAAGLAYRNLTAEDKQGLIGVACPTGRGFRLDIKGR
jgi:hypothetical protein